MGEAGPPAVPTSAVFGMVVLACLFVAELGEGLVAGKKAPPVTVLSPVGEDARCSHPFPLVRSLTAPAGLFVHTRVTCRSVTWHTSCRQAGQAGQP